MNNLIRFAAVALLMGTATPVAAMASSAQGSEARFGRAVFNVTEQAAEWTPVHRRGYRHRHRHYNYPRYSSRYYRYGQYRPYRRGGYYGRFGHSRSRPYYYHSRRY